MSDISEKKLYATKEVNPGDDVAESLDAINRDPNNLPTQYLVGLPDFKRAVELERNAIYRVNAPGWLFRAASGELSTGEPNGVIIQRTASDIDVYIAGFNEFRSGGGSFHFGDEEYKYASPNAKFVCETDPGDSHSIAVPILPKTFKKDFTQSRRHVYVSYSGSNCCQIVPVLPAYNSNTVRKTAITWIATKQRKTNSGGMNTQDLESESHGMYIMHCCHSGNEKLIFVPAASSSTMTYVTKIRQSMSECNLDMYDSGSKHQITNAGTEAGGECSSGGTEGVYANLSVLYTRNDTYLSPTTGTEEKWIPVGTYGYVVINPLPTDNYKGTNLFIYGRGHDFPFDESWVDIFSPGSEVSITGIKRQSWKIYIGSLSDVVPIPNLTANKLSKDEFPNKTAIKGENASVSLSSNFDLVLSLSEGSIS